MEPKYMKRRIAILTLTVLALSLCMLLAAKSRERTVDIAAYLPTAKRQAEVNFSQDGAQFNINELWELVDIDSHEVIQILKDKNPEWLWLETPGPVYKADIQVRGVSIATIRVGVDGNKLFLQRSRRYSKLAYTWDWLVSKGQLKVLKVKTAKASGRTSYTITESNFPDM